jgi:hypothetical protein
MECDDNFDDPACACLAFLRKTLGKLQIQATLFIAMDFLLMCYPHVTTNWTRRASDLHRDAIRTS